MNNDQTWRDSLFNSLSESGAHATFEKAIRAFPENLRGELVSGYPRTAWQIVEHMRICLRDILDYIGDSNYRELSFPDEYWPVEKAPENDVAWQESISSFQSDMKELKDLVSDRGVDLQSTIRGTDHTILREVLIILCHNSYHIGQLIMLISQLDLDLPDIEL